MNIKDLLDISNMLEIEIYAKLSDTSATKIGKANLGAVMSKDRKEAKFVVLVDATDQDRWHVVTEKTLTSVIT